MNLNSPNLPTEDLLERVGELPPLLDLDAWRELVSALDRLPDDLEFPGEHDVWDLRAMVQRVRRD